MVFETQHVSEVRFRFYGGLNDFLSPERKHHWFSYFIKGNPSVKDTIEAVGVVHVEVDGIMVNGRPVDFFYQLRHGDRISVYPMGKKPPAGRVRHLIPEPLKTPKFILDVHLGKLTRHLRLLGFDSLYEKDFSDEEMVGLLKESKRIILTRDIGLLKNKRIQYGYWVRSINPQQQIKEIVERFQLRGKVKPFYLCLECNGPIRRVAKSKIADKLPPKVREYYTRFYVCRHCWKLYWQGSHYERLSRFIKSV